MFPYQTYVCHSTIKCVSLRHTCIPPLTSDNKHIQMAEQPRVKRSKVCLYFAKADADGVLHLSRNNNMDRKDSNGRNLLKRRAKIHQVQAWRRAVFDRPSDRSGSAVVPKNVYASSIYKCCSSKISAGDFNNKKERSEHSHISTVKNRDHLILTR